VSVCIIFNPTARGEKAKRILGLLQALGKACVLKPTVAAGSAETLAAEAVDEGCETIVAAGGDGTVNEVVNGIGSRPGNFERVRLAVLPIGSANVFANELGLPRRVGAAWELILRGKETRVDLLRAEFANLATGGLRRRYAVQLAGAGFDAEALSLVDWKWKRRHAFAAYTMAALKAMAGPKCSIVASTGTEQACGQFVVLGNGRFYGGSIVFFPRARLDDGLLHVAVFPRVNWLVLARYGLGLFSSRLIHRGKESFFQGREVTLSSRDGAKLELDGDIVGTLPATVTVLPRQLRVIAEF
jgi:diacylglycerol kinase (ATP)